MGLTCSCIKEQTLDEEQVIIDKNGNRLKTKQDSSVVLFSSRSTNNSVSGPSVIMIQSILRGFLDRRALAIKVKTIHHKRVVSDSNSRSIQEIQAVLPDFSTPLTRAAAKKVGTFRYDKSLNDGIKVTKKTPVQLENGAIYIGEWNDK